MFFIRINTVFILTPALDRNLREGDAEAFDNRFRNVLFPAIEPNLSAGPKSRDHQRRLKENRERFLLPLRFSYATAERSLMNHLAASRDYVPSIPEGQQ